MTSEVVADARRRHGCGRRYRGECCSVRVTECRPMEAIGGGGSRLRCKSVAGGCRQSPTVFVVTCFAANCQLRSARTRPPTSDDGSRSLRRSRGSCHPSPVGGRWSGWSGARCGWCEDRLVGEELETFGRRFRRGRRPAPSGERMSDVAGGGRPAPSGCRRLRLRLRLRLRTHRITRGCREPRCHAHRSTGTAAPET